MLGIFPGRAVLADLQIGSHASYGWEAGQCRRSGSAGGGVAACAQVVVPSSSAGNGTVSVV